MTNEPNLMTASVLLDYLATTHRDDFSRAVTANKQAQAQLEEPINESNALAYIRHAKSVTTQAQVLNDFDKTLATPYQEARNIVADAVKGDIAKLTETRDLLYDAIAQHMHATAQIRLRDPELGYTAHTQFLPEFEVTDPSKVPANFMVPDKAAIRKYMLAQKKAGDMPEMTGVRFSEKLVGRVK